MTITQAMCTSFKKELLQAQHNFSVGGNNFRLALYDPTASLDAATANYSTANEVSGTGYTAGGKPLTNVEPAQSGTTGYTDFDDVVWTTSSFTARGCLIFNNSNANKAVAVYDFGANFTVTSGNFTVQMPTANATAAVLRIE